MKAPQIITIVAWAMAGGINLVKHGENKNEKYDFVIWCIATVIDFAILKWGGFF